MKEEEDADGLPSDHFGSQAGCVPRNNNATTNPTGTTDSELSSLGDDDVDEDTVNGIKEEASAKTTTGRLPKILNMEKKSNSYGLTPGISPYPTYPHPTPSECQEVNSLLSAHHGLHTAPATIPTPSLKTPGCGEVPSILDALIRTRLSAATNGKNSSAAFQGLVDRFGVLKSGSGKGSVDWDAVRRADVREVYEAIQNGGLAKVKSRDIKDILQMVYAENQVRRREGAEGENNPITTADVDKNIISLDHLHALKTNDEIMSALTKYPGIGVKTASCVMLFCMHRPSFAVDTHVFRLLKWLRWIPPDVRTTEINAFRHVEVKVPDELKYSLHKLFVLHGRTCGSCRARAAGDRGEGNVGGICVIEHLVKRNRKEEGTKKSAVQANGVAGNRGASGKKARKRTKVKKEGELTDDYEADRKTAHSSD